MRLILDAADIPSLCVADLGHAPKSATKQVKMLKPGLPKGGSGFSFLGWGKGDHRNPGVRVSKEQKVLD